MEYLLTKVRFPPCRSLNAILNTITIIDNKTSYHISIIYNDMCELAHCEIYNRNYSDICIPQVLRLAGNTC